MGGFSSVADLVEADAAGRTFTSHFRKVPSQATPTLYWADLSMAAGSPPPQYYASEPLVAATLNGMRGLLHGDDKSPSVMHLTHLGLMSSSANMVGEFLLLDYLLYYPFVDGDSADEQAMDNTVTLPRYTDGQGVMVMPVCAAPNLAVGTFTFQYVNQDGATKVSPANFFGSAALTIATAGCTYAASAGAAPFCALASGDTGVRQILSVTFTASPGGLFSFVLVKALAGAAIREANTMAEVVYVAHRPAPPVIFDDAYLNLIVRVAGSPSGTVTTGYTSFAWSD